MGFGALPHYATTSKQTLEAKMQQEQYYYHSI
jgi:hypothetical protein